MKIKELTPNPRNPRTITDDAANALRESLAFFGDLGSVIRNRRTGNLIGGHQRVAQFKADDKSEIVMVTLYDPPDPAGTVGLGYISANGTRYAYREVDWDPEREKAAMIAANAHGGDWDTGELAALMRELDSTDFLGFDAGELARLLPDAKPLASPIPVPDVNHPMQHECPSCKFKWAGKPKS